MGISVDSFVKAYRTNIKTTEDNFKKFINKHIVTDYVPYITKCSYCDAIVKATCFVKDGNREFVKINSANRYLFFVMRLIELYTDIEINEEEVVYEYDKLCKEGAINVLISSIPEAEYTEFSTLLKMKMDDFMDNEYSFTAFIYNLKESLNISEEIINSVIEEIKNNSNN